MAKAKKTPGTAVTSWDEELAKLAQAEVARQRAVIGGNTLSIRGSKFKLGGAELGTELRVVILDSVFCNNYYDRDFDPQNPTPPACFALSEDGVAMAPHPSSPAAQSRTCESCAHFQWGSAKGGTRKGKECREGRALSLIHADNSGDEEAIAAAMVVRLNVGPTSVPNWAGFVKLLQVQYGRPTFAVVTRLGFDPQSDYEKLTFTFDAPLERGLVDAVGARRAAAREALMAPPDVTGYKAPPGGARRAAAAPAAPQSRAGARAAKSRFG